MAYQSNILDVKEFEDYYQNKKFLYTFKHYSFLYGIMFPTKKQDKDIETQQIVINKETSSTVSEDYENDKNIDIDEIYKLNSSILYFIKLK